MALVLGTHVVREVVDDLAVTDEQQVVVSRNCARDLVEEHSHVLVAMTFAAGCFWVGGRPVERWRPGTGETMRWRTLTCGLQRRTVAELAEIQTPVVRVPVIVSSRSSDRVVPTFRVPVYAVEASFLGWPTDVYA